MKIVEFRIALPLTLQDFQRLCLYVVSKASIQEMENGSGIEIFKNDPYERDGVMGRYTEKRFHLAKNLPSWLQSILGRDLTILTEISWNTFPYTLTKYSNKRLTTFEFSMETINLDGLTPVDNALNLEEQDLSRRKVVYIDLNDFKKSKFYDPAIDVTLAKSDKTTLLPLSPAWAKEPGRKGIIAYKVLKLDIPYFGFLASKVENFVVSSIQDKMLVYFSSALCCIDEWHGEDIETLREKESECYVLLNQKFREQYGHLIADQEPLLDLPKTEKGAAAKTEPTVVTTVKEEKEEQQLQQKPDPKMEEVAETKTVIKEEKPQEVEKKPEIKAEPKHVPKPAAETELPPFESMKSGPIFIPPIKVVEDQSNDSDEFCDCLEDFDEDPSMYDVDSTCVSSPPTPLIHQTSIDHQYADDMSEGTKIAMAINLIDQLDEPTQVTTNMPEKQRTRKEEKKYSRKEKTEKCLKVTTKKESSVVDPQAPRKEQQMEETVVTTNDVVLIQEATKNEPRKERIPENVSIQAQVPEGYKKKQESPKARTPKTEPMQETPVKEAQEEKTEEPQHEQEKVDGPIETKGEEEPEKEQELVSDDEHDQKDDKSDGDRDEEDEEEEDVNEDEEPGEPVPLVEDTTTEPTAVHSASLPMADSVIGTKEGKYTPSVFTGYLYKLGGTFFYQWNIRYIVISGGKLFYFDSRENTKPKAAIHLTDARIKWVGEYMNRSYVFSVTTSSKRTSYWSADQEPSVKRWILLLQVMCENSPNTLIEDLAAGYLYRLNSPIEDNENTPPAVANVINGLDP